MKSVCALLLILSIMPGCSPNDTPTPQPVQPVVQDPVHYIDNGLGPLDRRTFYHLAEGSEIFPLVLVKAARDKKTKKPFIDVLENYGFIKDPNPTGAQDQKSLGYVGLTVSQKKGVDMVGVNCAACHVGQIEANGKQIRIDGAPNMLAINQFFVELAAALKPPNLIVLAEEIGKEFLSKGGKGEKPSVDDIVKYVEHVVALGALQNGTPALAGRADAFGAARALFFGDKQPLTAPASLPFLWGFQTTAWYHYIGNTESALERNIGQSLGLGASFDTRTCETGILFDNLNQMEKLAYKVHAPAWPTDLLGSIETEKAAAGKSVYMEKCAKCHDNYNDVDNGGPRHNYLQFPLSVVNTDEAEAFNTARKVTINQNMCTSDPPKNVSMPFSAAHEIFVGRIRDTYFKAHPDQQAQMANWGDHRVASRWVDPLQPPMCNGNQKNCKIYVAKSLVGVWATAPYLHNGSVPTIAELLKPENERMKTFAVGRRTYDTVNLGYSTDIVDTAPPFQVEQDGKPIIGNSNKGHSGTLFGTDLSPEQKSQLMEFLKSMKDGDQEKIRKEFQSKRSSS